MEGAAPVLTAFVRHGGRILLEETDRGWDGLTHPAPDGPAPTIEDVLDGLCEDPAGASVCRHANGDDLAGSDRPYVVLVDVPSRDGVATDERRAWRHPTVMTREPAAPGAWDSYRAVSPQLEDIITDEERGSTTLSLEALQFLRDRAAEEIPWSALVDLAKELVDGRAEFTALVTRVDRTMTRASRQETSPVALEEVAREEIDEAVRADEEAAERAAEYCRGNTVLTLSRSGTVMQTLLHSAPREVIFLESRPNREAVSVAESLDTEDIEVSLVLDAAVADVLSRRDVDVVLVGADSIDPNGDIRNKVGTRSAAAAAYFEDVPVIVVTSSDKIADTPPREAWVDPAAIYDGRKDLDVACPVFDRTPPELIDELVTEVGSLTPDITVWIAAERRSHRQWRDGSEPVQSV